MLSKIGEVFTKEYRKETKYQEFIFEKLSCFKLNNNSESVEKKVGRLQETGYVSNFKINVGEYKNEI